MKNEDERRERRLERWIIFFSFCSHLAFIANSSLVFALSILSAPARSQLQQHSLFAAMASRQQRTMDAYGTARRRARPAIAGDGAAALMGKVRRSAFVPSLALQFSSPTFFNLLTASR